MSIIPVDVALLKRMKFLITGIAVMGTRELDHILRNEFWQLAKELDKITVCAGYDGKQGDDGSWSHCSCGNLAQDHDHEGKLNPNL